MRRMIRLVAMVAVVAVFFTAAYAFTAANTQPENTDAGVGVSAVNGYDVTNIKYHMGTNAPGTLSYVNFNLNKGANEVWVWFNIQGTQSTYSTRCANSQNLSALSMASAGTWSCYVTTGPVNVEKLLGLSVYASQ